MAIHITRGEAVVVLIMSTVGSTILLVPQLSIVSLIANLTIFESVVIVNCSDSCSIANGQSDSG